MSPNCRSRSTSATRDFGLDRERNREVGGEHRLADAALAGEQHDHLAERCRPRCAGAVRGGRASEGALLLLELMDASDRGDQLVVAERLDQVLARASLHRAAEVVALALDRHDDHGRGGQLLSEPLGELDPIHDRHVHVGEHDVGQQPVRFLESLLAVAGGADDLDVLFEPEQLAQVVPSTRDVVDDEEPDQIDRRPQPTVSRAACTGSTGMPGPMVAAMVTVFT